MTDSLPPPPPPPPPPPAGLEPPGGRHRSAPSTSPTAMIRVDGVSKFFGQLVAVSDVSFEIGPGVTALLGPNGAGKSTLLRILTGQATPSKGTISILGGNPRTDRTVARQIGVAPQQETLFESHTALEFVTFGATLEGLAGPVDAARGALGVVELDPDDERTVSTYSKGMRQRVKLAQAIVHDPRVLLLDEPLTGLDPRQRLSMISLLTRLGSEGRCVVVSSHVLEEIERIGSRVLVIAKGRLAAEGDFHEIRELMNDRPHELRVGTNRPREMAMQLVGSGLVDSVSVGDREITVTTGDIVGFTRRIAIVAVGIDASLDELVPLNEDLESVFRYLVGA